MLSWHLPAAPRSLGVAVPVGARVVDVEVLLFLVVQPFARLRRAAGSERGPWPYAGASFGWCRCEALRIGGLVWHATTVDRDVGTCQEPGFQWTFSVTHYGP